MARDAADNRHAPDVQVEGATASIPHDDDRGCRDSRHDRLHRSITSAPTPRTRQRQRLAQAANRLPLKKLLAGWDAIFGT
jgi:hypothetical protein